MRRDDLSALSTRLTHLARLRNLSREETRGYIRHRLAIVGASPDLLDSSAIDALYELARGNLRATDTLAFKAFCIATQQKDSIVDKGMP